MTERNNVTVMEAIMHRRAIRRYDPRQIEESDLQQILEAGMYAPSAGPGRDLCSMSGQGSQRKAREDQACKFQMEHGVGK